MARRLGRKIRGLGNLVPGVRARRQKESLDHVERRVFTLSSGGKKISHDRGLEKRFFRLLEAMPVKPATMKLVEVLKSPSFTLPKRLRAMKILEKRNEMKAQLLYKQLLPVYDMPVPLRSRMVRFLGERIGAREEGIVFRKPLKAAMMDPAQSPIIRSQCIEVLASKPRPPKRLFKKIAENKSEDLQVRVKAREALKKLEKKSSNRQNRSKKQLAKVS